MKSWPPPRVASPAPCVTPIEPVAGPGRIRSAAARLVRTWLARSRDNRELEALTPRELRDLGISRYDALIEARKPFWRM